MPVTEFAILPLAHPPTTETPTLLTSLIEKLKKTKTVLEKASGYSFHYFQQVEDPSVVYIIGRWDSPEAHGTFLPSPENQELLALLRDDVVMEKMQMWHLNVDVFEKGEVKSVFSAPTISCNRHFVPEDKTEGFKQKFAQVKGLLEDFTKPYQVVGGWRIEKGVVEGKEREEWVLFSGFESVENHMEFAKTEGFSKYREIVGFVEGFEVKHLKALEV